METGIPRRATVMPFSSCYLTHLSSCPRERLDLESSGKDHRVVLCSCFQMRLILLFPVFPLLMSNPLIEDRELVIFSVNDLWSLSWVHISSHEESPWFPRIELERKEGRCGISFKCTTQHANMIVLWNWKISWFRELCKSSSFRLD